MTQSNATFARAVLTAIGADRPGLVEEFSQFIFHHGANIEDSRMVNLRGQFAMMVLVSASEPTLATLERELPALGGKSKLHTQFRRATETQGAAPQPVMALPYRLTATAMDQAGLVHRVAHLLLQMHVNIENLDSRLTAAPYTGAPMFEMELAISVPQNTPVSKLRAELGRLCDELNIDWHLESA